MGKRSKIRKALAKSPTLFYEQVNYSYGQYRRWPLAVAVVKGSVWIVRKQSASHRNLVKSELQKLGIYFNRRSHNDSSFR